MRLDGETVTRCKSCGAQILFATMLGGKSAPFQRDDAGEWSIDKDGNARHIGKPAAQLELGAQPVERWTSHFATCPKADTWRKR